MSFIREPDAEPLPGYRLIEPLGSGGFGEVWKCEAPGGLFKAIKFVYGNLNSLDVDAVRAEQEYKAIQRIKEVRHPFCLSLERIEPVEGELLIVMELADRSLHDLFVERQAEGLVGIPRDDLLRYLRDAAEALDHMNEKHALQHLDVKPRNLFLISDRVKVADFGLVKHLERHGASGLGSVTPLYAAPETYTGKISERSDQYSLAIVYQELLTGQRPFKGKNVRQLAQQHMAEPPDLRPLPEADRAIVNRALEKDPAKRYPNCLSFIRALYNARGAARSEPAVEASATSGGTRPRTLYETMEDFQLEQMGESAPAPAEIADGSAEEVSRLGVTVAQPDTGALRPTIIVGVGTFGRRAMLELRCRFIDRFGDLTKVPLVRFLYVDSDPEAVQASVRGTPEVALRRDEVYHLPLQPVGHYRRTQRVLDYVCEWLPREKLYTVPRSLQTQGSRGLGRLAFTDNHLRFQARLRREVHKATHPDTLYQSVSQTGLALRDNNPRIYIIAAAGGGNSGFLVDLGYSLRRLLQQMGHPDAEATLSLFCGTPTDPATPKPEQANVYATLTELSHFTDPAIPFSAQYGADGPRLVDEGKPFTSVYVQHMPNRTPEALRDAVAHLGSYLFHELTTPLGLRLDRSRKRPGEPGATCFRSFGTYSIWFPRGLLLRLAARQALKQLMEDWMATGAPSAFAEVEAGCARVLADPELRPDVLAGRLEDAASQAASNRGRTNGVPKSGLVDLRALSEPGLEGKPAEVLAGLLFALEEQSQQAVAFEDPGNWARQALGRIRDWAGTGVTVGAAAADWRKSRLGRALGAAAEKLAADWADRLARAAHELMQHPGRRVAAAEEALNRFVQFCDESVVAQEARVAQQAAQTQHAWDQLESALEACLGNNGGFTLFGNRPRRNLRVFMDHLAAFARQRLTEELLAACGQFFALLRGRLHDQVRDLTFCRQRLRHLQEALDVQLEEDDESTHAPDTLMAQSPLPSAEAFWEAIRESATAHVVLPEGEDDLETAASRFLGVLTPEQWTNLDQALQDGVLGLLGGLHDACMRTGDLARNLAAPLLDQAATCLGAHLPVTDVAEVEQSAAQATNLDPEQQAQFYFEKATPLLAGKDLTNQDAFLLVPASEAGKAFGMASQMAIADLQLVRVPGQAHLMFCREQGFLTPDDLQKVLRPCRRAYEELAHAPSVSPHARFDITDWVPIDP